MTGHDPCTRKYIEHQLPDVGFKNSLVSSCYWYFGNVNYFDHLYMYI